VSAARLSNSLLAAALIVASSLFARALRAESQLDGSVPQQPDDEHSTLQTAPAREVTALSKANQVSSPEIMVRGLRPRHDAFEVKMSAQQARDVAGTQDDPVKVVENLPGLSRAPFGSDQLVLWGAAPEDTRFYVDGVEIPKLFHGSGIRSTVNGNLLQSVALTPGAYGADYGRGIGGMVRLETRDLPEDDVHATLDASTLDGSLLVTAPLNGQVRVALAARYGWLDRTLSAVNAPNVTDYFAIPRYKDYQAKVQLRLRNRESLDFVLLASADALAQNVSNVDPARARSLTTSNAFERIYLRYRRALDDGSSVDIVPWFGRDTNRYDARFGSNPARLKQDSLRWGLRAEHRSHVQTVATLALGVDMAGTHSQLSRDGSLTIPAREGDVTVFGQPPGDDTNTDTWRTVIVDVAPYATLNFDCGPLTLTPGVRFDGYLVEASRKTPRVGQTPSVGQSALRAAIEPRLEARLRLSERVALLAAMGMYSQPPAAQDLSAVFGSPSLGLQTASHASLGESIDVTDSSSASVTGFYRAMSHLTSRDPSPSPKLAGALIEAGVGRSYGVQIVLRQRQWHGFFGWVAYTLSRSERRDTSASSMRLFDYDEPHVLSVVGSKELGSWKVGVRFRYASGAPRTPVVGAFYDEKDDMFQPIFGTHNGTRLPAFWQLDARVDRSFRLSETARLLVYLEVLNVTDHSNAEEFSYSPDYTRRGVITGLPFVGVLGVRLEI
jgi:hypothetical protein